VNNSSPKNRTLRRAHHQSTQHGYILLPVVLFITVIATIAFLINNDSTINGKLTAAEIEAEKVQQVARAGLAHAVWGAQNSGCAGDMSMTTVPFGQGGAGSYTATITTPGGTTTGYPNLPADQDAWIRSDDITKNNGGLSSNHLRMESGNLEYAVVRFDLSSLPSGAQINSAVARFYVKATKGHPEGPVNLHRATADWTEADATWETMGDNFDSATLNTIPAQPLAGDVWVQVNLTAQVQAWVNGGEPNYGIMLIPTGEGTHAEYISREGAASQQPRLDVIVGTGPASPATIQVTGTLTGNPSPANDIIRTLTRTDVPVYQPPGTITLQLGTDPGADAVLDSFYPRNYGGADFVELNGNPGWLERPLFRFDLGGVPARASVLSARLELRMRSLKTPGAATVHRVTRSWVEGTKSGTGTADGATWATYDGINNWASAGGDFDAAPVAETAIDSTDTWVAWEIAPLVEQWLAGVPNDGLLIQADGVLREAEFYTREDADATVHPRLTITYACECGISCLAPQGNGTVLMVVINPTTLVPLDAYKKALFESWGYTVAVIGESENQASYDSAIAAADVVFISETVNASQVGTKLKDVTIGVVSRDGSYNSALGFAGGSAWSVGPALNVTDSSHYITALFPAGPLDIYAAAMEQLTVSGTEAPGLQTLADTAGAGSLVVLDKGAMGTGGTPLAGRRVMLPLGRDTNFNWDYLNSNGRLLVQRALQWGTGNTGVAPTKFLLFVAPGTSPSAQEQLRIDLIESWGYGVNLIAHDDSQANFDAAVATNDVAYISSAVNETALGTKLRDAPIGVVNEQGQLVDEVGFGQQSVTYKSRVEIDVLDNTHYITEPFPTGLLTILSGTQNLHIMTANKAPGFDALAQVFNTGSLWDDSLGVIYAGGQLYGGGTAAGRRVLLPWGDATFDVTALNADGRVIMQRAIEWAEGAGSTPAPAYNVLLVVGNLTLSSKDVGYKALMESWGHTVTLIDDGDSQASYDTAMAAADVVYASGSALGANMLDKATNTTKGLVNEVVGKIDNFGFSSVTSSTVNTDTFSKTDALHYITESFGGNPVTVFTASLTNPVPGGTLAPDLQNVGEVTGTLALGTLDAGATRWDGNPSQGRRAHLPFATAETTDMTADGKIILQRALEWAAGAGGGGGGGGGGPTGVVFEEFTEAAASGTSLVINKPPGTAAGDLLVAAVATDGNTTASLAAAGWTVINVTDQGGAVTFGVWWKLAGASESSTYTFTWSGSEQAYGWIMRFTGHDPASPVDANSNDAGSGSAASSPSVTTTVDNALILRLGGFDDDDITAGDPGVSGHTAINMGDSGNGNATTSGGSGYVLQPAAGASGTASFSLTGSEQYVTVTLGVAPAP